MKFNQGISPSTGVSEGRIILAALCALVSILAIAWTTRLFLPGWEGPLLVASMGASSVLLFAVPASPMSRPWPLVGGHLCAGVIGMSCALYVPDQALAAALSVSGTILAMHFLRCLHPPGGAAALTAVVGGANVHALGYQFILTPVMLDVAIMLAMSQLLQRLLRGRSEMHGVSQEVTEAALHRPRGLSADGNLPFDNGDLDAALRDLDTYIDVSRDDLARIYELAVLHGRVRRLDDRRVEQAMDRDYLAVEFATPLAELWQTLRARGLRGAAVISPGRHVLGMVTLSDYRHHADSLGHGSLSEGLRHLMTPSGALESEKPEVVGQIMSRPAITTRPAQRLAELVPVFVNRRIHHMPVVDARDRILGMLTWENVLAMADSGTWDRHNQAPGQ